MKVLSFTLRRQTIEILWESGGLRHTTMLYRHSDYTWHPDADTQALLPKTKEDLQKAVISFLSSHLTEKKRKHPRPKAVWFAEDARPLSRQTVA